VYDFDYAFDHEDPPTRNFKRFYDAGIRHNDVRLYGYTFKNPNTPSHNQYVEELHFTPSKGFPNDTLRDFDYSVRRDEMDSGSQSWYSPLVVRMYEDKVIYGPKSATWLENNGVADTVEQLNQELYQRQFIYELSRNRAIVPLLATVQKQYTMCDPPNDTNCDVKKRHRFWMEA
jgi:hypothetical protein